MPLWFGRADQFKLQFKKLEQRGLKLWLGRSQQKPAKENLISSQHQKTPKCAPAWPPKEYPKEQRFPSAGSCNHTRWKIALSGWKASSKVVLAIFCWYIDASLFWLLSSYFWQLPVQGLKCKCLLLVIQTALLSPCQAKEAQKQGHKRIQPLLCSTHTPESLKSLSSPAADVCQAKQS